MMTANLCLKHFPEPIIYVNTNEPMCRKCIPEYLEDLRKNRKANDQDNSELQAQNLSF